MHDKYCDVQEGILLRKKLLKFGLGNTVIGPTARCNKSSIYIFLNGKVPYYFNIP